MRVDDLQERSSKAAQRKPPASSGSAARTRTAQGSHGWISHLKMDISLDIDISGILQRLNVIDAAVLKANEAAVRAAGAVAVTVVRGSVSFAGHPAPIGQLGTRTGRLLNQVQAKVFRSHRTGLAGVAVKVIGDRAHIMRFHENGTASHGGRRRSSVSQTRRRKVKAGTRGDRGPLPARQVFAMAYLRASAEILRAYNNTFENSFSAGVSPGEGGW